MNWRHRQRAIDRGVEERVEVVVGVRHAVLLAQALVAPHVAAPHQEHRRRCDPVHRADPVGDLLDARGVAHHHDGDTAAGRTWSAPTAPRRAAHRAASRVPVRPCSGASPADRAAAPRPSRHFDVRQIDPETCPQQAAMRPSAIDIASPRALLIHRRATLAGIRGRARLRRQRRQGGDRHAGTVRNASCADQSHSAGLGHAGGERRTDRRHPLLGRSARCGQPWHVDAAGLRPDAPHRAREDGCAAERS